MTIELKGPSKKSNRVIVPMLITGATLDLPIIGYNVLEELLSIGGLQNPEYNVLGKLSASFPMMHETKLSGLLDTVITEREAYLSTVKTSKRDTVIKAGDIAKLSCRVCNVMVFYVLVYFILYHVPSAVMLRVPILSSRGVLLSVVNTLSGQCAVPVNVSVIFHVLCYYYVLRA